MDDQDVTLLVPLTEKDWLFVWHLMLAEGFPYTPYDYTEACQSFERVHLYGMWECGELSLVIIIGQTALGHYLDVVCAYDKRGKWAKRPVLRQIHDLVFREHRAKLLFVETQGMCALKAALKAGFKPVRIGEESLLMMKKENQYGKFI